MYLIQINNRFSLVLFDFINSHKTDVYFCVCDMRPCNAYFNLHTKGLNVLIINVILAIIVIIIVVCVWCVFY